MSNKIFAKSTLRTAMLLGVVSTMGLLLAVSSFTIAFAQNPHFVGAEPTIQINESTNTVTSDPFKIAGLGGGQTITTTLTVQGTADITCTSSGQQKNQEKPSPGLTRPVSDSSSDTKAVPKNGQVTQQSITVTLDPSDVNTQGACPNPKFKAEVTDFTITSATLTIVSSSGDFSYQYPPG